MKKVYLAGGLFNAGERLHNLFLEKHLRALGCEVILPQREALNFFDGEKFDVNKIVADCQEKSTNSDSVYVGCIDGTDADSGAAVEYGLAINTNGGAIVYRTDFRTEPTKEIGFNAMFRIKGTKIIYEPCFFTELSQVDDYYQKLARLIHECIS